MENILKKSETILGLRLTSQFDYKNQNNALCERLISKKACPWSDTPFSHVKTIIFLSLHVHSF